MHSVKVVQGLEQPQTIVSSIVQGCACNPALILFAGIRDCITSFPSLVKPPPAFSTRIISSAMNSTE